MFSWDKASEAWTWPSLRMRSTVNPRLRKSSWYSEWQFTLYDLLSSGRFGVRTPVGTTDFLFSSSVQSGPVAHIAFYTMCRGSFLGKGNRRVALATLRDLASRLRTSRVIRILPTCAFMSCCGETLTFFYAWKCCVDISGVGTRDRVHLKFVGCGYLQVCLIPLKPSVIMNTELERIMNEASLDWGKPWKPQIFGSPVSGRKSETGTPETHSTVTFADANVVARGMKRADAVAISL
jgi:hypothetical protein